MVKLFALMALIFSSALSASSLSLIASDDGRINDARTVYLKEHVLFFGEQLTAYDNATGQFEDTEIEGDFIDNENEDVPTPPVTSFSTPIEFKGQVYFYVTIEQTYVNHTYTALMRTNGTAEGTQLFNPDFTGGTFTKNGFLLGHNADNKVLVSNGNSTFLHDVEYNQLSFSCVFAIDHVVYTTDYLPMNRLQATVTHDDQTNVINLNRNNNNTKFNKYCLEKTSFE